MTHHPSCYIIRVTPRGRAAVASLLLVGRDALTMLEPCLVFPKSEQGPTPLERWESETPVFAYFPLDNSREEVVLNFRRRHAVELHCHGGDAVVRAIETVLVERGAVSRTWQDWLLETQEPIFGQYISLGMIQREALQLLPFAETELTAKLLLAQYHGALSQRIQQVFDLLDNAENNAITDDTVLKATGILDSLLASYELGRHLTMPFHIGLIGPVNVGKSSLMNAQVGFNRSITSQIAGTTRDTVSARTVIAGWPVTLIDTAGIRETSNPIEQEGISRMQAVVAESDLLLLVTDVRNHQIDHCPQIIDIPQTTPVIHVANKIDLVEQEASLLYQHQPDFIPVSALTGAGLDQLNTAMIQKLYKSSDGIANPSQTALVFTERQYMQLLSARHKLEHREISAAMLLLYCLTSTAFQGDGTLNRRNLRNS